MTALKEFEAVLDKAIKDGSIPGAVLFARSKSGLSHLHAAGLASLNPSTPISPSTVFALASGTKLLTTIALLQLVERGLLALDADITPHIPHLAAQPILSPSGSATTTPRQHPITLRHLLTHTSGVTYPFLTPALAALKAAALGSPNPFAGATVAARYGYPLLFEPGAAFQYGAGVDWAGKVLEAVTGMTLAAYLREHVLAPLGIDGGDMTFFPQEVAGLVGGERFAAASVRDEETGVFRAGRGEGDAWKRSADAFGGEGVYASMEAYGKVLESLLLDDGRLLGTEAAGGMFRPALPTAEARESLNTQLEDPGWVVGNVPEGRYDWGLGGLLWDQDGHEYRKRGMLYWSGMFNMIWFIDREAGVCGAFGCQVVPVRDMRVNKLHELWEEAVYKAARETGERVLEKL